MKDELTGLEYIPAPEKPRDFDRKLREIVGECPTGEPWIRFVWGMDHKKWFGGTEDCVFIDPNGKYVGVEGFVMVAWAPAEVFDPSEWESRRWGMATGEMRWSWIKFDYEPVVDPTVDVLGPYPSKGVWDFCRFCFREDRSPMSFDEMLDLARIWKQANEGTAPKKRMLDNYMRHNDEIRVLRTKIWEEERGKHREFMAQELAKPASVAAVTNYAVEGAKISRKKLPSGMTETNSGLIVPQSTIDK